MPLESGVTQLVAYKAYASAAIADPLVLTEPGATGARYARRVSSSITPARSSFTSNEIRPDRQVATMRLGGESWQGAIQGEFCPADWFELLRGFCRGADIAAISDSNTEFTSAAFDNAAATVTFAGGNAVTEGYRVGDVIRFTNLTEAANNNVNFMITSIDGPGRVLGIWPRPVTMTADTAFNVTRPGKKVLVPTSGHTERLFAFEHNHVLNDASDLFCEGRVSGFEIGLPAEGIATISVSAVGRGTNVKTGVNAPYFTSVTAAGTLGALTASAGFLRAGGTVEAVLESLTISGQMQAEAPRVAFTRYAPDIVLGRAVVTGSFTALFNDYTHVNRFINETEYAVQCYLPSDNAAAPFDFVSIHMPRVKTMNMSRPLQGEGVQRIQGQFQALLPASATGFDQSTIIFQDSAAP